MSQPTLYEILSLSPTTSDLTPAIIKQAYRRALLTHHPDKSSSSSFSAFPSSSSTSNGHPKGHPPKTRYTIDQISLAYTTLSSPTLRTQYDASLRRLAATSRTHPTTTLGKGNVVEDFQTGIDTIDLDDMVFIPSSSSPSTSATSSNEKDTWYRPCRCGNERGFALTEEDLEENADLGEVLVQCADCTIWLRVCYVVAEDDDEDKEEEEEKGDGDDEEERKR